MWFETRVLGTCFRFKAHRGRRAFRDRGDAKVMTLSNLIGGFAIGDEDSDLVRMVVMLKNARFPSFTARKLLSLIFFLVNVAAYFRGMLF